MRRRMILGALAGAGAAAGAAAEGEAAAADPGTLRAVDPAPFVLAPTTSQRRSARTIARVRRRTGAASVSRVLRRPDHTASPLPTPPPVSGAVAGFSWDAGDQATEEWYPQGITALDPIRVPGGHDTVLATSWYSRAGAGSRVSFVRLGAGGTRYRHVLLVEPFQHGRTADFRPVAIHAGGLARAGHYLYVADTWLGLRVFDLRRILRVDRGDAGRVGRDERGRYHGFGHAFVLPQVQVYAQPARSARFSFVSTDASTSPPSLLTGEYREHGAGGRLVRWGLDPATGRLVGGRAWEAFASPVSQMQGALSHQGRFVISTSDGPRPGRLVSGTPSAPLRTAPWIAGAEGVALAPDAGLLWSLGERPGNRHVFAISPLA